MTFTVTIKARAVPVTVKAADFEGEPITVEPWQERSFHLNDSVTLAITEAEPAAGAEPAGETSTDEAAEEDERMRRRPKRAPAADSDSTQIG